MKVVTFISVGRNRNLDELSYFSADNLEIGGLYEIPIRSKKKIGVLIKSVSVSNMKSSLRSNSFELKSLESPKKIGGLPAELIEAATTIASKYAGNPGVMLHAWLPKQWLRERIFSSNADKKTKRTKTESLHYWQTKPSELTLLVERLYREKKDVAVIVADRNQAKMCLGLLQKFEPAIIHGGSGKKTITNALETSVLIATRSYGPTLHLLHKAIIIVNPGGDSWRENRWPYFHWDTSLISLGKKLGNQTYLWSSALDSDSWQRIQKQKRGSRDNIASAYEHPKKNIKLIQRSSGHKKTEDIVFDREAQRLLQQSLANQQKTLVYVTRRGLYPTLICQDCKTITYTKQFREQIQNYRINTQVTDWLEPSIASGWTDRCEQCGSWRLHPVSLSLEQTSQAMELVLPKETIAIIDTVGQKPKETELIIKKFYQDPETHFLLTTQRGAYNCIKSVDNTIVVSLDAALSTSSLTVETSMLRLLYHMDHVTKNEMIVQTRLHNNRVLKTFSSGSIRKYQNESLQERQALDYPPFFVQIKIELGPAMELPHINLVRKLVRQELSGTYSQLPGVKKNKVVLLSIPQNNWGSSAADPLKNYLANISSTYQVRINPDILL